jgi:Phosphotransferase enzyme family
MRHLKFASDASDKHALAAVIGPIQSISRSPLSTVGCTGATHERLELTLENGTKRRLVVKRTRPSADWRASRSSDRIGREAAMLAEPALMPVWRAFTCPYVAYAIEGDSIALVMDDLTPHLFPDVRQPIAEEQEERLLHALTAMHAEFWSETGQRSALLDLPFLARSEHYIGLLDACCAVDAQAAGVLPQALAERVTRGWTAALEQLPPPLFALMTTPAAEMAPFWEKLPRTIVHGDVKIANFALLPDGGVSAFDWALVGAAPASIDIGWYLAANASRLAHSKQDMLSRYHRLLNAQLAAPLAPALWATLVRSAIIFGARMRLWSKALAVEAERPGALAEWNWWVEQLEAACA